MKKFTIVIFCLAFSSLACLSTSSALIESDQRVIVATRNEIGQTISEPFAPVEPTSTNAPQLCARVVAIEALHLRGGASENDIVLTWLRSGVVVQVVDQVDEDWWRVQLGE